MALKDVVKVSRKTFINPRAWLGYDQIKSSTVTIWRMIRDLFSVEKPAITETFEEALERLNLSAADVKRIEQNYQAYSYFFVFLTIVSVAGSFYWLIHDFSLSGFILGGATSALFATQAFRYSFWLFQMTHRKLGCTFAEWRSGKTVEEAGRQP